MNKDLEIEVKEHGRQISVKWWYKESPEKSLSILFQTEDEFFDFCKVFRMAEEERIRVFRSKRSTKIVNNRQD